MDTRSRVKQAFTLVELLVVISVIALLIAILLPTLTRARESARRAACLANVRSLVMATHVYANDNGATLFVLEQSNNNGMQWADNAGIEILEGLLADTAVLSCPNFRNNNTYTDDVVLDKFADSTYAQLGYIYTGHRDGESTVDLGPYDSGGWATPTSVARSDPALTLWSDRQTRPLHTFTSKTPHSPTGWRTDASNLSPQETGAEGVNGGRLDGSADWRPLDKLEPYTNTTSFGETPSVYWW